MAGLEERTTRVVPVGPQTGIPTHRQLGLRAFAVRTKGKAFSEVTG